VAEGRDRRDQALRGEASRGDSARGDPLRAERERWMRRVRRVHLVGIGGAGMGAIAEVLHTLGFDVSGSDVCESAMTRRLRGLGVRIEVGHAEAQISDAEVVVVSTAIRPDNPEVAAARAAGIPTIPRAEMLAELMRFRHGIAIAGTHGKTTTTGLVAAVLEAGGLDPSYVIGGRLLGAGTHARLGRGEYLVAEADESDASFLLLQPMVAVVTNVDADHMETYDGDFDRLRQTFVDFLHRLPFYGLAVLCIDDENVRALLPSVSRPLLTYGFDDSADVRAEDVRQEGTTTRFTVRRAGREPLEVALSLPGRHNVLNALAAVAVASALEIPDAAVRHALDGFAGIARRLQVHGVLRVGECEVLVVDDYAHHPRELEATLEAARGAWPRRRIVAVFQPHRYTRTRDLFEDFTRVLSEADALVLLEVYPAGEAPLVGADGRALAGAVRARGRVNPVFVAEPSQVPEALEGMVEDRDVILTLGAGDVGTVPARLAERWRSTAAEPRP
jgi:UDP-N-acetylmuramate--alanine ligase